MASGTRMLPLRQLAYKLWFPLMKRYVMALPPSRRVGIFARALRIRARLYGADHFSTLLVRIDYDVARHKNGDSQGAEADLADLIARFTDAPPPVDRVIYTARIWYGRILSDLGRLDDAERVDRELAQDAERDLGRGDRTSVDARENHAAVLYKLGRIEEAEAELADVIAWRTAADGADAESTLKTRQSQAALLNRLGRLEDSETAWRAIADAYERNSKQTHPDALRAQEKHAVALYKLGRVHEAAAEFVQLADRLAATRGVDHPDTTRVWTWRDDAIRESADTP